MTTAVVQVNERAAKEIRRGALHIYSQNITSMEAQNGDWVEVRYGSQTLGYGFYTKKSSIPVKLFSSYDEDPGEILRRRLEELWKEKRRLYKDSFRWVFAEGDKVPGLIIDVFEDVAALKISVYGLERYKEAIVDLIVEKGIENVVERNDSPSRDKEGLPRRKELLRGKKYRTEIEEGSVKFLVDVLHGQKTGFYLDQRENRIFSEHFSGGKVLDVFSYTGGFGIHLGGDLAFIEQGSDEVALLRENLRLNHLKGRIIQGDAIESMKKLLNRGEAFDVISMDPPALAKKKTDLEGAKRTYFLLNRLAMRLLKEGGILLTSSCSHPLSPKEFLGMVRGAAEKEGRTVRMLGSLKGQAPDHTVYLPQPETLYLKHAVLVVE
jgi:23S rRNA (cytosine1962-C5)-methyltransferase